MVMFAPFPLTMASVIYGRMIGYAVGFVCLGLTFLISVGVFEDLSFFMIFLSSLIFSVFLTEIVLRGMPPMNGVKKFGFGFLISILLMGTAVTQITGKSYREIVREAVDEKIVKPLKEQEKQLQEQASEQNSYEVLAYIKQPELLVDEVLKVLPSYLFISIFFILWANLFLVLKSRKMLFLSEKFEHTEKSLLNYKVSEGAIWILIASLLLALFGADYLGNPMWADVGMTLLKCLGIFYFFQGFGLYIRFLDHIRLGGMLRSLMIIFTVMFASWLVALVGVFDMWVNFEKFFQEKSKEN
jgi:hypothetical protein